MSGIPSEEEWGGERQRDAGPWQVFQLPHSSWPRGRSIEQKSLNPVCFWGTFAIEMRGEEM